MKNLKEKELLVNFARSMGQDVDPDILEEVEQINAIKNRVKTSVQENVFADLFNAIKDIPKDIPKEKPILVREEIYYPPPPSLDDLMQLFEEKETVNELVQTSPREEVPTEENISDTTEPVAEPTLAERTARFISEAPKDSYQQPDPLIVPNDMDAVRGKLKFLEQWVSKISMAGPGSGEVNLRYLDDVARNTISDGLYLRYNESTKKFIFDHGHQNAFYGAFQSTVTQTCGANTAVALTYNQTDFSYGITVTNNSRVVIQHPGLYNAQFSVQLTNSDTKINRVYIWLRQNGEDVVGSAGKIDVPSTHGGAPGAILIGWNFYINTTVANEYFEFVWFTPDDLHVIIPTLPAQEPVAGVSPYIPSTASVVLTVSPVKIN